MSSEPRTDGPATPQGRRLADRALATLDAVIAATSAVGLLYLAFGGFDLGFLSVRRFSKPFLLLLVMASLRAAIPRSSWLSRLLGDAARHIRERAAILDQRTPWAAAAFDALVAVLTVHLLPKGTAFLAHVLFPAARPRPFPMPFEAAKFAETFAAWDSGWYFDIAQRGYYWSPSGQSSIAFFPLYPMLMRALAWPFGGGDRALWIAGIALSYTCLFLGLAVLHRLTARTFGGDREAARRTLLYVAVFPFAYFFTQVYTESLFLLTSVSAVAAAVASRWGWAGLFGALAALTRPNGILIALPLGLLALAGRPRLAELMRRAAALALVPLGFGAFCAYAFRLTGDPLAWLHAQAQWGYTVGNRPWGELMRLLDGLERQGLYGYFFSDPLAPYYFLHGMVALAFVALTPSVFTRVGTALGAYVAVSLYLPLSGNALEGIGRYAATLFPVFMLLGTITSRRVHEAILIGSALVLSLLTSLFAGFYPIY
ncbi:MAG TPA: mannosyltransferase family protein [Vicinamibacteria bacterium]|nr:mannosyltransferase family protein [Vicinamibacteria bacterium]